MGDDKAVVDIRVYEHIRTELAIFVSENGEEEAAVWLPLSKVTIHENGRSFIRDITLPEWLAKAKGLI